MGGAFSKMQRGLFIVTKQKTPNLIKAGGRFNMYHNFQYWMRKDVEDFKCDLAVSY